jgi:dsDNA-binding SOS-regulon protein
MFYKVYIYNKQQNREKSDIKFDLGNSDLNEEQKEILTQFLNQNRNVFATNLQENLNK